MIQEINKRCFECRLMGSHTRDCPAQSLGTILNNYKDLVSEMRHTEDHRISIVKENMTRYQGRIASLILENNALRKANNKLKKQ